MDEQGALLQLQLNNCSSLPPSLAGGSALSSFGEPSRHRGAGRCPRTLCTLHASARQRPANQKENQAGKPGRPSAVVRRTVLVGPDLGARAARGARTVMRRVSAAVTAAALSLRPRACATPPPTNKTRRGARLASRIRCDSHTRDDRYIYLTCTVHYMARQSSDDAPRGSARRSAARAPCRARTRRATSRGATRRARPPRPRAARPSRAPRRTIRA